MNCARSSSGTPKRMEAGFYCRLDIVGKGVICAGWAYDDSLILQTGTPFLGHHGSSILFYFPVWYFTFSTSTETPLIPQPSGGPAVAGIPNHKWLTAKSGYFSRIAGNLNWFNTMQYAGTGWPSPPKLCQHYKSIVYYILLNFQPCPKCLPPVI